MPNLKNNIWPKLGKVIAIAGPPLITSRLRISNQLAVPVSPNCFALFFAKQRVEDYGRSVSITSLEEIGDYFGLKVIKNENCMKR